MMSASARYLVGALGIVLLIMFPPAVVSSYGQSAIPFEDCTGGTLFYIAFPEPVGNVGGEHYTPALLSSPSFSLMIYSPVGQQVAISYGGVVQRVVTVAADVIIEQRLESLGLPVVSEYNVPVPVPVKVESESPIIVYACMTSAFGCGAYTVIPVEGWGTEHYVATWPGQTVYDVVVSDSGALEQTPKPAAPEILIVAASDNTEVSISPASTLADCKGCSRVTLNAGEVYRVRAQVSTDTTEDVAADLSGTRITSTKPVGVISGNTRFMQELASFPELNKNVFQDLTVEWISPVNQHGTEFVYTPTFDDRRWGETDEYSAARDQEYVRLFATTDDTSIEAEIFGGLTFPLTANPIQRGEFVEDPQVELEAAIYRSSGPVLAMKSPGHSWSYAGWSLGLSNLLIWSSWATYMAELVSREQWTSFAPIHTPARPDDMQHYLNVVVALQDQEHIFLRSGTDEPVPFIFNQDATFSGDYVWGTLRLEPGKAYYIIGREGAQFTGTVYGLRPGRLELLVAPERVREYREDLALSYGYPLAPSRCVLAGPDEPYTLETDYGDCGEMTIRVSAPEENPPGIRSLTLLPDSSANVQLEFIDPDDPVVLKTSLVDSLHVRLVPVSPSLDAHGVLIVKTRSKEGQQFRIEYTYQADRLAFESVERLDFGIVRIGERAEEHELVFTNLLDRPVIVKQLRLLFDTVGFDVLRTEPVFDWSNGTDSLLLDPGDSLRIWVNLLAGEGTFYTDSLFVEFACGWTQIPLFGEAGYSCLNIESLDFLTAAPGSEVLRQLRICNAGSLPLVFEDPLLTWENDAFSVDQAELDKLKGTELGRGECVTVTVKFKAGDVGEYHARVRVWSNNYECPDSTTWVARVDTNTTSVPGSPAFGYRLGQPVPNPSSGNVRLSFQLGNAGIVDASLHDAKGRPVATIANRHFSSGEHEIDWDGSALPAGIYYLRLRSGDWTGSVPLFLVR